MLHIHKRRGRKHNALVQQQTRLSVNAISAVNNAQKVVQVNQRHVRIDIFNVALQQGILKRNIGQRQGALDTEILHIFRCNLGGQRPHKGGQRRSGIGKLK